MTPGPSRVDPPPGTQPDAETAGVLTSTPKKKQSRMLYPHVDSPIPIRVGEQEASVDLDYHPSNLSREEALEEDQIEGE